MQYRNNRATSQRPVDDTLDSVRRGARNNPHNTHSKCTVDGCDQPSSGRPWCIHHSPYVRKLFKPGHTPPFLIPPQVVVIVVPKDT